MSRPALVPALALLLITTGCYDFLGEKEAIGFTSNLELGDARDWSPDTAIVAGSRVLITAVEAEGHDSDSEEPLGVTGRAVSEDVCVLETGPAWVKLTGEPGEEAKLAFEGVANDTLTLRFEKAKRALIVDPLQAVAQEVAQVPYDGFELPGRRFTVVDGTEIPGAVRVFSREDAELGFVAEDLTLSAKGAVQAVRDEEGEWSLTATTPGAATVDVKLLGRRLGRMKVKVVPAEAVQRQELRWAVGAVQVEDQTLCIGQQVGWIGKTPVHGLTADWTGEDEDDRPDWVLTPCPDGPPA